VLRVLALVVGGVAGLFGVWGVVLVLGENRYLDGGGLTAALAGVTVLAMAGAALAWWRPLTAGLAMAVAAIGYLSCLWGDLGGWWSAYQDAVRTSGAAENAFWLDNGGAAMALFLLAAALLVVASALAAFSHDWRRAGARRLTTA
jgi:hypothetical protein